MNKGVARGMALVYHTPHLDEDEVPDLQHAWVVHVDEVRRVTPADAVKVDLRAGAAGALVAHLPKIILAAKGQHTLGREELQP